MVDVLKALWATAECLDGDLYGDLHGRRMLTILTVYDIRHRETYMLTILTVYDTWIITIFTGDVC